MPVTTEWIRFNALVEKGSTDCLEEAELNWLLSYYTSLPMLRYLAEIGLIKKMQRVDKATSEPIFSKVDESTFVKKGRARGVRAASSRFQLRMLLALQLDALHSSYGSNQKMAYDSAEPWAFPDRTHSDAANDQQ